jgi:hypothetical protein
MGNIVPSSALQILERTLGSVRLRANSNGECFGGEIMDAMREAGVEQRVDRLEILLTRTILVQRRWNRSGKAIPLRCCKTTKIGCPSQEHSNI